MLVADVWQEGADKYAPRDWVEGQSFSTLLDCAMRHMLKVLMFGPHARCEESGNLHVAHVAWNILTLLTFIHLDRNDLDDVTPWFGITAEDKRAAEDLRSDGHPGTILEIAQAFKEGHREAVRERNREVEYARSKDKEFFDKYGLEASMREII